MGEEQATKKPWWAYDKQAWRERFDAIYKLGSFTQGRDKPLKRWSDADVEEFIRTDPVYGPQLKVMRRSAKFCAAGAVVGGLSTTALVSRYAKVPHGLLLSLVAGTMVGWCLAEEAASITYGLHKIDCMEANLKFFDWWKEKTEG
ncbi:hypothetical protein KP509_18G078100 [Ceratopteris richardii]|uniref:Succinate dehydrogenase subunit 6, mitochondrial n=1 Tax=Ceratopteris richardii TaxID=49495 RepID=A0A8T2SUX2_CERRI|nr:hypothetical protein KP509_18G078100 [Ceratopteris richardii]